MLSRKRRVLTVVAAAELLAMSLWFSATAAAPELAAAWGLTDAETAWLTTAVQIGFVVGALLSSVLTVSDVVPPRYLFAGSAVAGAGFTAVSSTASRSAPTNADSRRPKNPSDEGPLSPSPRSR